MCAVWCERETSMWGWRCCGHMGTISCGHVVRTNSHRRTGKCLQLHKHRKHLHLHWSTLWPRLWVNYYCHWRQLHQHAQPFYLHHRYNFDAKDTFCSSSFPALLKVWCIWCGVCKRVFQWWKCGLFKCSSTGIILWHNLFYSTVSTYWFNGVLQLWEHICHPLMESKRGRCELPCRCPTYKWWPALLWILYSYLHLWRPGVWWNVHFLRWILQWNLQQLIKWISGGRSR